MLIGRYGSEATVGPVSVQAALRLVTGLDVEKIAGARGSIEIRYRIAGDATPVSIHVYDVAGRDVRLLEQAVRDAGEYRLAWDRTGEDGVPVARGVHLVRLTAGATTLTKRVVVVHNRQAGTSSCGRREKRRNPSTWRAIEAVHVQGSAAAIP